MAKLIKINLNQTVNKALLSEMKKERIRWVYFGLITSAFVGVFIWFLIINQQLSSLITHREERIDDIIKKTKMLKEEGIDLSKQDIENLYKLESDRKFWAVKLEILSKITPDYMTVTELNFHNNRFIISAISQIDPDEKEFTIVDDFINKLMAEEEFAKDFKTIKFLNSERVNTRGQDIFTFKIDARIDQSHKIRLRKKRAA